MLDMLVNLLIGGVLTSVLWQVKGELSCIKNELKHLVSRTNDHEDRIRKLEGQ